MGEETTTSSSTSETQGGLDPTTETVTQQNGATPGSTTTEPNNDLQERFARMEAALKKANSEAKSYRLEADDLKKFKEQIEAEKLSDTEKQALAQKKLEQQLAEHQGEKNALLKQLQETRINNEVFKQASKLNIIDVDAASKLIDASRIEYDDAGNPTNIDALLKDLVKQRSWLVGKPQQTSGGATNPSRSQTNGLQNITKEQAQRIMQAGNEEFGKLSPEEQMSVRRALNPKLFRN